LKQYWPSFSTEAGTQNAKSDEHPEKVPLPIRRSSESDWNVTVERQWHFLKQYWPSFSTDEGMQIAESDEQFRNARRSIQVRFEPDSNVTVDRD
jgi:hypothetical protein